MPACKYCGEHYSKGGAITTHEQHCNEKPELATDTNADTDTTATTDGGTAAQPGGELLERSVEYLA